MNFPRCVFFAVCILCIVAVFPAAGQSVISTRSGVVYFFEGSVFLGDQPLQQSFGKFPEIGDGGLLRTEHGRAEVLLTPGSVLRVGDNSSIRMTSTDLADTRVELVRGSAILESREPADTPARLLYKGWQVRLPQPGIYRIDAEPAQVSVNKGEVEITAEGSKTPVTVKEGEVLPLQEVLVTESADPGKTDDFDKWAMGRSQAIYADNTTAAEIFDEPQAIDASALGLGYGGFSRFPITGIPSLGLGNPYGLSFWSPFQPSLYSLYIPIYQYAPIYMGYGYPSYLGISGLRLSPYPRSGITLPSTIGARYPSSITSPRIPSGTPIHAAPARIGAHPVGHR
jgi:hypothetical protein